LDCIENDLESIDVKRWKKKSNDKSVWAIILKGQWLNCENCVPLKKKKKRKRKEKKNKRKEKKKKF